MAGAFHALRGGMVMIVWSCGGSYGFFEITFLARPSPQVLHGWQKGRPLLPAPLWNMADHQKKISDSLLSPPQKWSDILLPVLTQDTHGLWVRRFPGASRKYTKLRAKRDLYLGDIDLWISKHSQAFGLYKNLVITNIPAMGNMRGCCNINPCSR